MTPIVLGLTCTVVLGFLAWVRRRGTIAAEVSALQAARERAAMEIRYRAPTSFDVGLVRLLEWARIDEQELRQLGFTALGDLIIQVVGDDTQRVLRALVDRNGTTAAILIVSPQLPNQPMLTLTSYSPELDAMTVRGLQPSWLAMPAFAHRQLVDPVLGAAQIVAKHRAFAWRADASAPLTQIESIEALAAEMERRDAMILRWRSEQPAGSLLDADLRCLLGDRYTREHETWARRLAVMPKATVLR